MRRCGLVLLLLSVLIAGCGRKSKEPDDTITTGVIRVAVDETFMPVFDQEISVFESLYPYAGIVPSYVSEREAINLFLKDSVRLAITTRGLTEEEVEGLKVRKFYPTETVIAKDGIALITHKSNRDTLISVQEVRRILTGELTSWGELCGSSKSGPISVVFDNPNSSTVRFALDSICRGVPLGRQICSQQNNSAVIAYVASHPDAIGVIGVSWVGNRSDSTLLSFLSSVNVMGVSREHPATYTSSFKPYQAYIAIGDYPLSRVVYALLNDPRGALPSGFYSFLGSDRGQRVILKSGLVPATQPVRIVNIKE